LGNYLSLLASSLIPAICKKKTEILGFQRCEVFPAGADEGKDFYQMQYNEKMGFIGASHSAPDP